MAASQRSTPIGDQTARYLDRNLTRHDFPSDFIWGTATSCYQVEGGYAEGKRALSNWDVFSMQKPEKIDGGTNGCVSTDHYHRFKEDVALMKNIGVDTYRFSLSWSRILPGGRLSGGINKEAINFYNCLIDELISNGIEPCVTIFHFDLPQSLEAEYGGFLDHRIVQDFAEYAEVCFFEFGDRVKIWITENEALTFTELGYAAGSFPPGHGSVAGELDSHHNVRHRCAPHHKVDRTCYGGDAGTEPYIVGHNLLLAHAAAVDIYRRKFQAVQGGKIGVTNVTSWFEPYDENNPQDIDAAHRALDFTWGWFVAPIVTGDYPPVMRKRVGKRLPKFTHEQTRLLTGSFDFIGMNYYTTNWAQYTPSKPGTPPTYYVDQELTRRTIRDDGTPIGQPTASTWLFIVPEGLYKLLTYTKNTYNDPVIYITENGVSDANDPKLTITKAQKDPIRESYYKQHLAALRRAMDQGVKVQAYYAWALLDNYEWAQGYTVRFGFFYVDFNNNLNRYPKESVAWFMNFLNKNLLPGPKRQVAEDTENNTTASKKRKGH